MAPGGAFGWRAPKGVPDRCAPCIQSDLATISDNAQDLEGERRSEIESASDGFRTEVQPIASGLPSDLSPQAARAQFRTALSQLDAACRSTLEPIDCS